MQDILKTSNYDNLFYCLMPKMFCLISKCSPSLTFLLPPDGSVCSIMPSLTALCDLLLPSWFYTTDLCPPGCRWAHPQCCSPPPLLLCPPASSSYGSCGHGSQPGSWQRPCWPLGRPGGCPWCPPPPGAGCSPPAERDQKVAVDHRWVACYVITSGRHRWESLTFSKLRQCIFFVWAAALSFKQQRMCAYCWAAPLVTWLQ